jgi:hypothetical protein
MINFEIWDYTHANFALGALEFGSGLFVLGCTHDTTSTILQLGSAQCVGLQDGPFDWSLGLDLG